MERNSSYGTSWADQWDYSDSVDPVADRNKESAKSRIGRKVGDGLEKTKAVAASGIKKVKEGTFFRLDWIKDKYKKRTHKP